MRKLFSSPLGASVAPFGIFKHSDVGTIIGSGLGLMGSLLTNQINAERAASDMSTYLNLVNKQRGWQNEDKEWSRQQTYDLLENQRQYDSPSAQMQRYRDAGLNPYLAMDNGSIGSGAGVVPQQPTSGVRGNSSPFLRPALSDSFASASDKLFNASALKSQRIASLSNLANSVPTLVKSIGSDSAKRFLSDFFGNDIDTKVVDTLIDTEVGRQSIAKERESLQLQIEQMYGKDSAALVNQNLIFEGQKIVADINKLYSEKRLNDASINEVIERAALNVAQRSKLNADTDTVNQLRPFVVKSASMQAEIDSYNKVEEQARFIQRSGARSWMMSDAGKFESVGNQIVEDNKNANLINKILRGQNKK